MIYHIFDATASHLSLNLIEAILRHSSHKHFFILIGEGKKKDLYVQFFKNNQTSDYIYYVSYQEFKCGISSVVDKNSCILLHAGEYRWMGFFFLHGYRNVNWICWGSGMCLRNTLKSRCSFLGKYVLYHYFKSIVVLMTPELEYVKRIYKVKNAFYIPYLGKLDDLYEFSERKIIENVQKRNEEKLVIFLGNNVHSIPSYIYLLDVLCPLKGKIAVHCMVNYSLKDGDNNYAALCEKGMRMYGKDFVVHTEFYDLKDYPSFMDMCDVYICGADKQTGLGAIYTCIKLGKKIYLLGNNYSFFKEQNYIIYSCDELKGISYDALCNYSLEERLYNFRNYKKLNNFKEQVKAWEDYYDFILQKTC